MITKSLTIQSERQTYTVEMPSSLNHLLDELSKIKNAIAVIDRHIAYFYPEFATRLRTMMPVESIEATEETKTLAGVESVLSFLLEHNTTKASTVIAIGGGIVQDIVSFSAHIYYRGLSFVFVPTTLLAMSDSCIGAKCGLNYKGYKNQIGGFHAPQKVLIWTGFIETLSDDAIYSGYGEIYKLMLIGGQAQYNDLVSTLSKEGFKNTKVASYIMQGLEIKKTFIEEDEFDTGVRRILNYGHTFGHALELATHYEVPHGVAVVRGIDIANYIAYRKGLLSEELYLEVHDFIEAHFDCGAISELKPELLILNAQRDKKIADGKLNMILLEQIGKLKIEPVSLDINLTNVIKDYTSAASLVHC